jgi:hypothetical protein
MADLSWSNMMRSGWVGSMHYFWSWMMVHCGRKGSDTILYFCMFLTFYNKEMLYTQTTTMFVISRLSPMPEAQLNYYYSSVFFPSLSLSSPIKATVLESPQGSTPLMSPWLSDLLSYYFPFIHHFAADTTFLLLLAHKCPLRPWH